MKSEDLSVKRDHILETAIRRFSHFGINKTSLSEIAQDLGISKPSLFYYFDGKNSLIEAVGQKIVEQFLESLEASLAVAESIEDGLTKFIEIKRDHFKKYLLLAIQADQVEISRVSPLLVEVIADSRKQTAILISRLLSKEMNQQDPKRINSDKTSHLVIDIIEAFEHSIKEKSSFTSAGDIDALFNKQREVIHILINGLKNNPS